MQAVPGHVYLTGREGHNRNAQWADQGLTGNIGKQVAGDVDPSGGQQQNADERQCLSLKSTPMLTN